LYTVIPVLENKTVQKKPSFLDSFLDMSLRRNNIIFSPWSSFFPTCDSKTCKKLMGERKMVFFPHFHIFPPFPYFSPLDHAVFGSPSQTVMVLRCIKDDFYPWLKCAFFCE
jgi:hypothetical protein